MLTLAIPNRNGARYLEQTLQSLARNRPHVRWWFQDSCSSDCSVELARRFAGPEDRIKVESDSSQAEGLNRAFASMGGDIVGFLNGDDLLADGAAQTVLTAFADNPGIDLVYGEVEWIGPDGQSEGLHAGSISSLAEVLNIYQVWWKRKQWVQPEVFWRRSLWDKVGSFNPSYDLAFDFDYWVRCFQAGVKVKRIPSVLARFRRHAAQKSSASAKAAHEIRTIVQRALAAGELNFRETFALRNRLSYDLYHAGRDPGRAKPFWYALGSHPWWLALPHVRERLALSRRFFRV